MRFHIRQIFITVCYVLIYELVVKCFLSSQTINYYNRNNNINEFGHDHATKFQKFYPRRNNMSECKQIFGKVTVMVVIKSYSKEAYRVAQDSLQCYLKSTNYTFMLLDIDTDKRVKKLCNHHRQFFFKRHCAVAAYLNETDWMFVMDGDVGVVNPNHCIEEWIDDSVNIMFYERFLSLEIMSGSFIIRNTEFSFEFLRKWANWEFHERGLARTIRRKNLGAFYGHKNGDNGPLQLLVLETVIPSAKFEYDICYSLFKKLKNFKYFSYVLCVRSFLGATYYWPGKIRIYRKGHGWARDGGHLTYDDWSEHDFMIHDWKGNDITKLNYYFDTFVKKKWQSPFMSKFDLSKCGKGYSGWNWRKEKKKRVEEIRLQLEESEKIFQKFLNRQRFSPFLDGQYISRCYPRCDNVKNVI